MWGFFGRRPGLFRGQPQSGGRGSQEAASGQTGREEPWHLPEDLQRTQEGQTQHCAHSHHSQVTRKVPTQQSVGWYFMSSLFNSIVSYFTIPIKGLYSGVIKTPLPCPWLMSDRHDPTPFHYIIKLCPLFWLFWLRDLKQQKWNTLSLKDLDFSIYSQISIKKVKTCSSSKFSGIKKKKT